MPSDYDALYRAEVLDPLRLVSYRHRGVPPAAEAYPQSLWLDVFVQFVVSPLGTETVSGLVTCYALNERNQTAKLALSGAETEEHAPLAMRGLLLFINYLFGVHPIRKLYGEVLSWNRHQFASMERYGATLEGCLRGHELHGDQEVDLYIYGLTRGAWRRYKTAIERQGAGELSPSEAVRSVLELEPGDVLQITSLDSLDRVVVAEVLENTFELLVPDDVLFATTADRFDAYLAECDYAWSQRLSATL